jgi:hypothetical protein
LPVYRYTREGSRWISRQGTATPGVYARLRSRWVLQGLVGRTASLPCGAREWYSNASSLRMCIRLKRITAPRSPQLREKLVVRSDAPGPHNLRVNLMAGSARESDDRHVIVRSAASPDCIHRGSCASPDFVNTHEIPHRRRRHWRTRLLAITRDPGVAESVVFACPTTEGLTCADYIRPLFSLLQKGQPVNCVVTIICAPLSSTPP